MNRRDDDHEPVAAWMVSVREELFTTPLIVAEIDHLVSRAGGLEAARAFYEDLTSGAYLVEWWPEATMETVAAAKRHRNIGLADASLLALAARLETTRVATSMNVTSAPSVRSTEKRLSRYCRWTRNVLCVSRRPKY